jgi:hypothetical protein
MKRASGILLAAALLMLVFAPGPAHAQAEKKLKVEQMGSYVYRDEGQLNEGRLPPETALLRVDLHFKVIIPPLSVCLDAITVAYTPPPSTPQASIQVSPTTQTRPFEGSTLGVPVSGLHGMEMDGFKATLTIQLTRQAPAFQAIVIPLKVQALTSTGSTSSGCGLIASDVIQASAIVVPDYMARVDAQSSPWQGNTPQPISVTNYGNGMTRVRFAWESASQGWVSSASTLVLESRAQQGSSAVISSSALLDRHERPHDWTRRILATGEADVNCSCQTSQVVLGV